MHILIFVTSSLIALIGVLHLPHSPSRRTVLGLVSFLFILNGLDVFIDGNQTVLRQAAYLVSSVFMSAMAVNNSRKNLR